MNPIENRFLVFSSIKNPALGLHGASVVECESYKECVFQLDRIFSRHGPEVAWHLVQSKRTFCCTACKRNCYSADRFHVSSCSHNGTCKSCALKHVRKYMKQNAIPQCFECNQNSEFEVAVLSLEDAASVLAPEEVDRLEILMEVWCLFYLCLFAPPFSTSTQHVPVLCAHNIVTASVPVSTWT